MLRTDYKLEVKKAKDALGLTIPELPPKVNMYSNYVIIEHILKYLMINQIYSPELNKINPEFKAKANNEGQDTDPTKCTYEPREQFATQEENKKAGPELIFEFSGRETNKPS